ncbi:MAG: isoprenyl transferase [Endomicrobiaceae bacterium]|nr:isoprenyl transferase [Endomicrobiaceae bacterium]MDD3729556.1 isoprenyl transferase [Endomicrobiaceae bacterium]MDD4165505.1 isoprenyl transferase [Endomicrobiaceae bacterium]
MSLREKIDFSNLPVHVAIIMDGNGRWAKKKLLPRNLGHTNGVKTAKNIVELARSINIKVLTLYAFSTENWKRPEEEISGLMWLLKKYLKSELATMQKNNISFRVIGDISKFPEDIIAEIKNVCEKTKNNDAMIFNFALNYGSRQEILRAVKNIIDKKIDTPSEQDISDNLYTAGQPDPDLLIRTSGEMRISNFLLWQIAYSEIYITDVLWPDFSDEEFYKAIIAYQQRERRFGGI